MIPLEAILVICGRSFVSFYLFESSWKNMKIDTTFVRMRRNGFRSTKEEGHINKMMPQIF